MPNLKPYTGPHPEVIERLFLNWMEKIVAGNAGFAVAKSAMLDALIEVDYYSGEEDEGYRTRPSRRAARLMSVV